MPEPIVLRAESVFLRLGRKPVLNRISLDVRQGRCLVIMGANGVGKSQLLRVLNGLAVPDTGTVLYQGRELDRAARNRTGR